MQAKRSRRKWDPPKRQPFWWLPPFLFMDDSRVDAEEPSGIAEDPIADASSIGRTVFNEYGDGGNGTGGGYDGGFDSL